MGVSSIISRSYDLNKPLVKETLDHLLAMGDDQGDQFNIAVTNGNEPKDLLSGSVLGYFIKLESGKKIEDCETVTIFGTSRDNIATVILPESCYVKPCRFILTIKVSLDDTRHAVYIADGAVQQTSTDHLIDPGHNIPDIEELLALIAQIEGAADRADEATERADSAAKSSTSAAKAANDAANDATSAAKAANDAANDATSAAKAANDAANDATSAASDVNAAKESATEAANKATTAAFDVGKAVEESRAATSEASYATANAYRAAERADNAAIYIENVTFDADQVPNNQGVNIVPSKVDDHLHLHFDIPEGPPGPKGDSGSIENFSITLQGDVSGYADGSSGDIVMDTTLEADVVRSVAGIQPDDTGNVPLKIGGRNYALGSSEEWSEWIRPGFYNEANQSNYSWIVLLPDDLKSEDRIAFSLEIEFNGVAASDYGNFRIRTMTRVTSPTLYNVINQFNMLDLSAPPEDGIVRVSTVAIPGSTLLERDIKRFQLGFRMDYWRSGAFRVRKVKVELGNVPSDWLPNPDDLGDLTVDLNDATAGAANPINADTIKGKDISSYIYIHGDLYEGRDLTVVHAEEIRSYSDPWKWIKARISASDFSDIHVEDYIPVTCTNGQKFNAQIAGINTYKNYGNTAIGNHIDFISDTVWPTTFKMNLVNFNNGRDVDHQFPWLSSNGYHFINSLEGDVPNATTNLPATEHVDYTKDGIYYYLPDSLKSVIVEKLLYLPKRFSASNALTDDNAGDWTNIGKLWFPTEFEVAGANIWGSARYGTMGSVQYPLFANNMNRDIGRSAWWTLSAASGYTTYFVYVNYYGTVGINYASTDYHNPVCFRVM